MNHVHLVRLHRLHDTKGLHELLSLRAAPDAKSVSLKLRLHSADYACIMVLPCEYFIAFNEVK